jgi:hypothetical protein
MKEDLQKSKEKKKQVKSTLKKIETRGLKRQKNLEITTTYVIPAKVTVNMT